MSQIAKETINADLEQEMRKSYLDYAMSVIVGRALPDVRDGLKPVHRRVLYAMTELNNDYNKAYKKSARIVGDVIGKYHPHGDTAVYDTIVRMAQNFSMRYPLIDGQGNFGSVDGDSPAAMRYTEIRLAKIAHELLSDIDKETVDFGLNYDETEKQPLVLPSRVPNLLVNGSSGIAVGMATNIPPHNLTEVVNGCLALVENESITIEELNEIIPGPDFPTKGIISGRKGIRDAYRTGRGKIYVRARAHIEEMDKSDKQAIVVDELPYMVNKSRLLEKIVELVKDKKVEGITAVRDESDKQGMRVVVELRRGEVAEVILNNLYKHTQMQTVFGINMVALINNQPRIFNLKDLLEEFIRHRREVVTRRTIFELRKARSRAHILEGLAVALSNIDEIISLIKKSANPAQAKAQLIATEWSAGEVIPMLERTDSGATKPEDLAPGLGLQDAGVYRLSEIQAQAILDLRLHRLTGLEKEKLHNEYIEIVNLINDLLEILQVPDRLIQVVKDELIAIRDEYGDSRVTEITASMHDMSEEDFIVDEEVVVTLSHSGYIKSQPLSEYKAQRRGGRGKSATATKDADFIENLFVATMHDTMLCFSNHGQVYWLKVYQFPQAGRLSKGKPIINLLPLSDGEYISAIRPIREYTEGHYIVMATKKGIIKKCLLTDFSRPRASGIRAVNLNDNDQLIDVAITDGSYDILLFSDIGKAVRFSESQLRPLGRTAKGVTGIKLASSANLISMKVCSSEDNENKAVIIGTENGFGKRTKLMEYPSKSRSTKGVISIQTSDRNGLVVAANLVDDSDEIMLITNNGVLIRTKVNQVSVVGRNTQGVKLINMAKGEKLIGLARVQESKEDELDNEDIESDDSNNDDGSDENALTSKQHIEVEDHNAIDESENDSDNNSEGNE